MFGGTFDPPHIAHSMAVLWALQQEGIDRVVLVPTARHAFGKEPAAIFEQRLEMCRLATELFPWDRVEVSDLENRRSGTSYMVDTLRELSSIHPGAEFRLLVGSDVVRDLPKWKESDEVLRMAPVLELPRILPDSRRKEATAARSTADDFQHGTARAPCFRSVRGRAASTPRSGVHSGA